MQWSDVFGEVAKLSPVIGTALGGPVGGAVGTGLSLLIQQITGKQDPAEALAALQADPNKLLELEQRTKELESENLKAELADAQNARATMIQALQAPRSAGQQAVVWGPVVISLVVLIGFFVAFFQLFYHGKGLDPAQADLLKYMFGFLGPLASGVVWFWTGSTRGSQAKDLALSNSVPVHALPMLAANSNRTSGAPVVPPNAQYDPKGKWVYKAPGFNLDQATTK